MASYMNILPVSVTIFVFFNACFNQVIASTTGFAFRDFNKTNGLMLRGKARSVGPVLRLVGYKNGIYGFAFFNSTIPLVQTTSKNGACVSASFNVKFSFSIYNDDEKCHAGGIAFAVLASNINFKKLGPGGLGETYGLQYRGSPKVGSLITIFDTYRNYYDPKHKYVGVREKFELPAVVYNRTSILDDFQPTVKYAWIEYNGTLETLHVYLSKENKRPTMPLLTYKRSLCKLLRPSTCDTCQSVTDAYIGLSAGTGYCGDNHDITGWSFSSSFDGDYLKR